ncbi:MAG: MarR family transcriptional regulator [Bacteroidota bacterium]
MLLEKEIQQKNFKSPQQKLAINLLYTTNWLNYQYHQHFKNHKITVQQFNVLRILRGQYPDYCSLKVIKERMLDRMSDASRIVDKLVEKKYIIRHQCPSDRRSVNLMISDKGLAILKDLDVIDESTKDMFKNLNTKDVDKLNQLLDALRG